MTKDQSVKIEKFYLEMREFLLSYAQSALDNRALAEEAVQETFRIVCLKADEFFASPNPKGWIIKTLKYTIKNTKRSRDSATLLLTQYLETNGKGVTFSEDPINLELTYGNVAHSEEFQLIREMAVEGKSHLEMAQARGISVDACKKRVQRAKEFLRKKI